MRRFDSRGATEQRDPFTQARRWAAELRQVNRLRLRPARLSDVPDLVEVDLRAFNHVYREYGKSSEDLRAMLCASFEKRLARLGPDWTPVLCDGDRVIGFLMGCRTSRSTADFRTWEEMTDAGTLESTYDPDGRNLYIVTLSMLPSAASRAGQNMLFANQISAIIRYDITEVFFESRLPGLRGWTVRQCRRDGRRIGDLTDAELHAYAETYLALTRTVNGREVPQDPLLAIYHRVGARVVRLIENGYQDGQSLNFGALCVLPNPMPGWAQRQPSLRALGGHGLGLASRSFPD
jgi:hypothetical protein